MFLTNGTLSASFLTRDFPPPIAHLAQTLLISLAVEDENTYAHTFLFADDLKMLLKCAPTCGWIRGYIDSELGDGSWEFAQKYCQQELISKVIADC